MTIDFSFSGGNIYVDSGKLYTDSGEVGDGNSLLRPLHATEVNNKLKSRDFNIYPRKYVKDGELYLVTTPTNDPDIITNNIEGVKQSHQGGYEINTQQKADSYNTIYSNDIEQMKKMGEIYIYDASKKTIDLLKSSVFINVVQEESNLYTTTADLGDILVTSFDGKIDLSLRYTKGEKIYNYSTTMNSKSDTSSGNDDIEVEYMKGVVSVFPKSKEVKECIINSLQITYGFLQ